MSTTSLTLNPPVISKFLFLINIRVFLVLTSIIVVSSLVFYVFQVNAEASERYLIQEYERRLSNTLRESQSLEIGLVRTNSLDNMMALIQGLNFVKIDKIHYIRVGDNQMVTRPIVE